MTTATITTFESERVDASAEPWAVTDEDAAILRHDFGDDRRLTYWLPRRAIPVDFDGHQATINVDPVEVVRWATFVDHVKADVVFSGKPAELLLWFALDLEGITAVEDDGRVDLIDTATGALVGVLPRPFLLDADRTRHECAWETGTGCILAYLPDLDEAAWLGAVFDPTTIDTATSTVPTGYVNQKKVSRLSTGMLVAVFAATTTNAELWYSSDNGATWTQYSGSDIAGWSNGSIYAYLDSGGTERIVAVWKQSGAGGARTDARIYGMVGTFNAGRTTITWGAAVDIPTSGIYNYPDVVAHAEGGATGGQLHLVVSSNADTNAYSVNHYTCPITAATIGAVTGVNLVTLAVVVNDHFPSIDIDPATKRLHVCWSGGNSGTGIRYRTAPYSAATWPWATEVAVDTTRWAATPTTGVVCRWDGSRVVIGGCVNAASNTDLVIWDSTSFTAFTLRASVTNIANASTYYGPSMAIDAVTGNVYVYGSQYNGSAYADVAYIKATRTGSALALGARTVLATFTGQAATPPYVNARFDSATRSIEWVYDGSSGSPYNVTFDRTAINTAPTTATWVTAAGTYDVAASLAIDWTFNDPDAGDTQSAYALKRDIGGTVRWWNGASFGATVETFTSDAATILTLAAGWGADGDADHNYYVLTKDVAGATGTGYSSVLTITPSAKVNPTLDTPAAAAVVATSSLTAAWTVAQQTAFLLELLDAAGTTVLWTTGWLTDAATRTRTIAYALSNTTSYKVRLTTKNTEGLTSDAVTHSFTTSFTAPTTATLVATATDSNADGVNDFVRVAITNPAPAGSQPAISGNDLYRRVTSEGGAGIRIATGVASSGTYDDYAVASGVAYQYMARALGVNTVTSDSAWTS